jgi:uncharacterized membrane protein
METKTPLFKATKAVKKDIVIEDRNITMRNKLLYSIGFIIGALVLLALIAPSFKHFGRVTIPGLNDSTERVE